MDELWNNIIECLRKVDFQQKEKYYIEEHTKYHTSLGYTIEDPKMVFKMVTNFLLNRNSAAVSIDYDVWYIWFEREKHFDSNIYIDDLIYVSMSNEDYPNLDKSCMLDLSNLDKQERYDRIYKCMEDIANTCHFE